MALLSIDIGGTSIKYGTWDNGELSYEGSFPTPDNYDTFKEKLTHLKQDYQYDGVAISAPGTVNHDTGVILGNSAVSFIHDFDITTDLTEFFETPVTIENDAHCAGFAEVGLGNAKDFENSVFIIIGTGIGGAIFINKQLYTGTQGFAGEFSWIQKEDGKSIRDNISIVEATSKYKEATGTEIDGPRLFELRDEGDELAIKLIDTFYDSLTRLIQNLTAILNPEAFIIGGGVSKQQEIPSVLQDRVQTNLNHWKLAQFAPQIRPAKFNNNANLIGAAIYFEERMN